MHEVLLAPVGDLDIEEVDGLAESVDRALASGPVHLTIDLTRVAFTSVAVLGLLAEAAHEVGAAGGRFSVVGARESTRRTMRLCNLSHLLADEREPAGPAEPAGPPAAIVLDDHVISLDRDERTVVASTEGGSDPEHSQNLK